MGGSGPFFDFVPFAGVRGDEANWEGVGRLGVGLGTYEAGVEAGLVPTFEGGRIGSLFGLTGCLASVDEFADIAVGGVAVDGFADKVCIGGRIGSLFGRIGRGCGVEWPTDVGIVEMCVKVCACGSFVNGWFVVCD